MRVKSLLLYSNYLYFFLDLRSVMKDIILERKRWNSKETETFHIPRGDCFHDIVLFLNIRDKFQICSKHSSRIFFFRLLREIKKITKIHFYTNFARSQFCSDSHNYFISSIRDSISSRSFIFESKLDESMA